MSEQLPIEAWEHILIRVSDVAKSKAFYERHLGFETERAARDRRGSRAATGLAAFHDVSRQSRSVPAAISPSRGAIPELGEPCADSQDHPTMQRSPRE